MAGAMSWVARLPFFYGWLIIAIAFLTMAISVTARTSFSLLLSPLMSEFGWERGLVAGAFSAGFLFSAVTSPLVGQLMDRYGPRVIIQAGVLMLSGGLLLAPLLSTPWQLYATLGVMAGGGANLMSFTAQSLYLPNWFVRRRAMAISIAFSGVGVGAIVILPWLQAIIEQSGWRSACQTLAFMVIVIVAPLNLLVRHRPQSIGLLPDGDTEPVVGAGPAQPRRSNIVDPAWAAIDWTLSRAIRTRRFWWVVIGYFTALFAWYAIQVHQTTYLIEIGYSPLRAAWALGVVSMVGIPGQIVLGALSDRIGREWIWSAGCLGFIITYSALIALEHTQSETLLLLMIASQGFLGYAMTSVLGPIVMEIFDGPHFGSVFGMITVFLMAGGAAGPWAAGYLHDLTGSYRPAFIVAIVCCVISIVAIWLAAPRKVRCVAGQIGKAGGSGQTR